MYNNLIRFFYLIGIFVLGLYNTLFLVFTIDAYSDRSMMSLMKLLFYSIFYFFGLTSSFVSLLASIIMILIINGGLIKTMINNLGMYMQLIRVTKSDDEIRNKENIPLQFVICFDNYYNKVVNISKTFLESSVITVIKTVISVIKHYCVQLNIASYLKQIDDFISLGVYYVLNKMENIPFLKKISNVYSQLPIFEVKPSPYHNDSVQKELEELQESLLKDREKMLRSQHAPTGDYPMTYDHSRNMFNMPPPTEQDMMMFGAMMGELAKMMEEESKKRQ